MYTYTDFLSPADLAEVVSLRLAVRTGAFGGADFAERRIVRFGDFAYDEPYPISIIYISPTSEKFGREVTHRDFLGSLLGLGIERSKVGDIFISGKSAYVAVCDTIAEFIVENLKKVGANTVRCTRMDTIPNGLAPRTEEFRLPISSLRLDAVLCRLYNLSREAGGELFRTGRVSVNGRVEESPSFTPRENDVISVRGFGKFIYRGECGRSAKGRLYVLVEKYI